MIYKKGTVMFSVMILGVTQQFSFHLNAAVKDVKSSSGTFIVTSSLSQRSNIARAVVFKICP